MTALKNTGFEDALEELGLSEGSGSDGVLPSGGARQGSGGVACNNILSDWRSFNSSADRAVPGQTNSITLKFNLNLDPQSCTLPMC